MKSSLPRLKKKGFETSGPASSKSQQELQQEMDDIIHEYRREADRIHDMLENEVKDPGLVRDFELLTEPD